MKSLLAVLFFAAFMISCGEETVEAGSGTTSKNKIMFEVMKNYENSAGENAEDCDPATGEDCSKPDENTGSTGTDSYGAMPLCPEIIGLDFSTCPAEKGRPVFIIDFGRSCVLGMKCDYAGSEPDCPMVWEPVCGVDGNTYDNKCFAELNKVEIAYFGECKWDGECKDIGAPVDGYCGEGQKIYPVYDYNGCVISWECTDNTNLDGTDSNVDGDGDGCPDDAQAVCGSDDVTYKNKCQAYANNVEVVYEGPCK